MATSDGGITCGDSGKPRSAATRGYLLRWEPLFPAQLEVVSDFWALVKVSEFPATTTMYIFKYLPISGPIDLTVVTQLRKPRLAAIAASGTTANYKPAQSMSRSIFFGFNHPISGILRALGLVGRGRVKPSGS